MAISQESWACMVCWHSLNTALQLYSFCSASAKRVRIS